MSDPSPHIRRIIIAGDTLEGWMSAAFLARLLQKTGAEIALHPCVAADEPQPGAVAALPSLSAFHQALALDERDIVRFCGATFRLGVAYAAGPGEAPAFVHAYGAYGRAIDASPFRQHWLRLRREGSAQPYDAYSPGARAGLAGRFSHPLDDSRQMRGAYDYGLHLDRALYTDFMRRCALHYGARGMAAPVTSVIAGAEGVSGLRLANDEVASSDLYIDASGRQAALIGALAPAGWRDAPARRRFSAVSWTDAPADDAPGLARARIGADRLSIDLPLQAKTVRITLGGDAQGMGDASEGWRAPRRGNCIAIGRAAASLTPLEGAELRIIEAGLAALRRLFPHPGDGRAEETEYNRVMTATVSRLHDFQRLQLARGDVRPETLGEGTELARRFEQFASRGRVVTYDEETFDEESWAAAFIGAGVLPERIHPLALAAPIDKVRLAAAHMLKEAQAAADALPTQKEFLVAGKAWRDAAEG